MIVSVPKTMRRLYFMTMLVTLSCLAYYAMSWIGSWINPYEQSEIPEGTAIRAFQEVPHSPEGLSSGERLRFYYWYGE
ncbi:DUF4227 family protein [Paenibacillus graminis]|uniref:DUF4227 domain-containing protein n=1 Tax=Paenibacillus graminis TaxID=189425 RepID=A0A089MES0_9BACL|nr:DUF4227 family protein [Paenibacillus graminis]AIQ69938.1 hypothetical protein PGRAT_21560 [Paenibacillus graminis]